MKTKKLIASAALCVSGSYASAQDLIVKKDGSVIQAKVTKIGSSEVEYKKWSNQNGPQYSIAVADIFAINYQNGEKETFENVGAGSSQAAKSEADGQQSTVQVKPEDLSPEAKAANDALIAKYNAPVELNVSEKLEKKIKTKPASNASAIYGIKTNTIVTNEDVELDFTLGTANKKRPSGFRWVERNRGIDHTIMVSVRNKSSKTIYIDLGNTFYISLGQSLCYYTPTSTTTEQGSQSGVGVNLGSITGALGIGGVAGALANGINIGGGSTKSNATTTYSQRIVAVPPMGAINLSPQYMFGYTPRGEIRKLTKGLIVDGDSYYGSFASVYFLKNSDKGPMLFGDRYRYTEENSPLQMSIILSYSFKQDCSSLKSINSSLYLRELIGINIDSWHEMEIKTEGILYNMFGTVTQKKIDTNIGEFPRY